MKFLSLFHRKKTDRCPLPLDVAQKRHLWLGHYFVTEILAALDAIGVWKKLKEGNEYSIIDLAEKLQCNKDMLEAVLDYLWINTPLIEKHGELYAISATGKMWQVDWLVHTIGAYRPVTSNLAGLLTGKIIYGKDIRRDGNKLQRSSYYLTYPAIAPLLELLKKHAVRTIVDLGCGSGEYLAAYCSTDKNIRGLGVEIDLDIAKAARKNIERLGLGERVTILEGDLRDTRKISSAIMPGENVAFVAVGVMHEFLRDGEEAVIKIIKDFRREFPGARFIIGEFNALPIEELYKIDSEPSRLVISFYQLIHPLSGQGNPQSQDSWEHIFEKSGATVEIAHQTKNRIVLYDIKL